MNSTTPSMVLIAFLLITSSTINSQEESKKHVNKNGTRKTVSIIKREISLIEEKTLPLIKGFTGEIYYDFQLAPHEKITFDLETENSNQIHMRLATIKDPSASPEVKMQALAANESLKSAPRQNVSFQNLLDSPYSVILHLKGHVNYYYKIKISRTPGA